MDVDDDENNNPDGNTYTPVEDDVGYFLRATASYDDGQGDDKDEDMVSYLAVRAIPYSNTAPVFLDAEGMEITCAIAQRGTWRRTRNPATRLAIRSIATDAAETGPDVLTYTLDDSSNKFSNRQRYGSDRGGTKG